MKLSLRSRRSQVLLTSFALVFLFSACSHKKPKEETDASVGMSEKDIGSSDTGNAMGLKTIHFDFDAMAINSANKAILKEDAGILKEHPSVKIQVEGHCDARGGVQYNIALGEKRATSVKHFLQDQGIAENRITTVSFGKERPIDSADTEEAYAKNRRANLVITSK
jgi:peptidoglycan-associated lipoprotein